LAKVVLEQVTKVFGEELAVDDLSFECNEGEFFVLLGPSGAGKTTVLNLIAGLEEVTRGKIWIGDKLVNDVEPRSRDVAYAFENYSLYPHLNVYDNICFPLRSPIRKREHTEERIKSSVEEIATTLQINQLLERNITQLSGGQKQRVALARTLIRDPAAYLLDEAIAHLDAKLRHSIRWVLKGYQEAKGVTTIYATPDQLDAVAMCDRLIIIRSGRMEQMGNADDVYRLPTNEFVATYVGYPPMNVFRAELVTAGDELNVRLNGTDIRIPGEMKRSVEERVEQREIKIGIRPHDIELREEQAADGLSMPSEVIMIEHYGDFRVVHFRVEGAEVKVRTGTEIAVEVGQRVWLTTDADKFHMFIASDGRTVWPTSDRTK